ncbi:MAG: hypothetical protein ACKVRP_00360 [Bacteroidota bacterium]
MKRSGFPVGEVKRRTEERTVGIEINHRAEEGKNVVSSAVQVNERR